MAQEQSRFFDFSEDRMNEYQADEFAEFFRLFLSDGLPELGTNLQVTADGSGMLVKTDYGAAIVQGYGYWLKDNETGVKTLPIAAAHASYTRIDRVVLRRDKSVTVRTVVLAISPGTPAASPVPPELNREGNIYELSLAQIRVEPGVLNIAANKVTDERSDNDLCGIIAIKLFRDYINQALKTTDSPVFAGLTVGGTITADKVVGAVYQ